MIGEANLWATVQSLVKKEKVDLIVLGTRGWSGAGNSLWVPRHMRFFGWRRVRFDRGSAFARGTTAGQ